MSQSTVKPLYPSKVEYKGYTITLRLRPKTNDWEYSFTHTTTLTIRMHAPRYETAVKAAKYDIDALTKDKVKKI